MTIASSRNVSAAEPLRTDVCIIGSGAAGLTIARQLDGGRLDALVLEAGGLIRDPASEQDVFHIEQLGHPALNPEPSRGRAFGGSTSLWFGRIAALDRIDFATREWVPHSGWPISYEEMHPWIEHAATVLEVPNFDRIDPDRWEPNRTVQAIRRIGGIDVGVFLWSGAREMGAHHRRQLERSRNVRLLLDTTVTELVENAAGTAIDCLHARDPDGREFHVQAAIYVLAAGGIENPRLLLASTARSKAGVGNARDLVGRYFMDHPRGEGLAQADLRGLPPSVIDRIAFLGERTSSEYGAVQLRVTFSAQLQREEELLNSALHAHLVAPEHASAGFHSAKRLVQRWRAPGAVAGPIATDVRHVIRDARSLSRLAARKVTARTRPATIVLIDQMEQEPDPDSRVTVDHARRDRYGMPQVQTRWRIGESTYRSQRRMHELARQLLCAAGVEHFTSEVLEAPDATPQLWDMKHPSGTTRMSSTPASGVVDPDGLVHGLANLYVTGSSVFPTVGHANPTLTIVALAARLAAHLATRQRV